MLTEFQRKKLLYYFRCLDADGSGYLEKQDAELFALAFASLRGAERGSEIHADLLSKWLYVWDNYWSAADLDGDGRIGEIEFCYGIEKTMANAEADPLFSTLFDIIDRDGDGQISPEEHRIFFRVFGLDADTSALVFSKLDVNGDGILSKEEFIRANAEFITEERPDAVGNWFWGAIP